MKAKKRVAIDEAVRAAIALDQSRGVYSVLQLRFANGKGLDVPYLPWKPRQEISLPGRWEVDE